MVADPGDIVNGCTAVTTSTADVYVGTKKGDVVNVDAIPTFTGTYIFTLGGSDAIYGGQVDGQYISPGPKKDGGGGGGIGTGTNRVFVLDDDGKSDYPLYGGNGVDVLYGADGAASTLSCGANFDTAYADPFDTVYDCDTLIQG